MDHADTAQLAAVLGALGAALVLLARTRSLLLAGFALLGCAEAGLIWSLSGDGGSDLAVGPLELAAGAAGLVLLALGVAALVRWPAADHAARARRGALPAAARRRPRRALLSLGRGERRARAAPASLRRPRRRLPGLDRPRRAWPGRPGPAALRRCCRQRPSRPLRPCRSSGRAISRPGPRRSRSSSSRSPLSSPSSPALPFRHGCRACSP